jgi:hypothetical protein
MAIQLSTAVRNARLDTIETTMGTGAVLKIATGAQPTDCASSEGGSVLVTIQCDSDWMNAASGGSKTFLGTWSDTTADATGTAAHFRLYANNGTTCGMQGTVTATGGGGDMTLDSVNIASGQTVTITTFTWTDANA